VPQTRSTVRCRRAEQHDVDVRWHLYEQLAGVDHTAPEDDDTVAAA
jgi:hypothetical protein